MIRRILLAKQYKFYIVCVDLNTQEEKDKFAKLILDNNRPYPLMSNVYAWKVNDTTQSSTLVDLIAGSISRQIKTIVFEQPDEMSWRLTADANEFIELNLKNDEQRE